MNKTISGIGVFLSTVLVSAMAATGCSSSDVPSDGVSQSEALTRASVTDAPRLDTSASAVAACMSNGQACSAPTNRDSDLYKSCITRDADDNIVSETKCECCDSRYPGGCSWNIFGNMKLQDCATTVYRKAVVTTTEADSTSSP